MGLKWLNDHDKNTKKQTVIIDCHQIISNNVKYFMTRSISVLSIFLRSAFIGSVYVSGSIIIKCSYLTYSEMSPKAASRQPAPCFFLFFHWSLLGCGSYLCGSSAIPIISRVQGLEMVCARLSFQSLWSILDACFHT